MACTAHAWFDITHTKECRISASETEADGRHGLSVQTVGLPAGSRHHALAREMGRHSIACLAGVQRMFGWTWFSVESALVDGSDLVGTSFDWRKCFDRVPNGIAFQLSERQGLHTGVLKPFRDMFRDLYRRFVMAGVVGREIVASNGVIHS